MGKESKSRSFGFKKCWVGAWSRLGVPGRAPRPGYGAPPASSVPPLAPLGRGRSPGGGGFLQLQTSRNRPALSSQSYRRRPSHSSPTRPRASFSPSAGFPNFPGPSQLIKDRSRRAPEIAFRMSPPPLGKVPSHGTLTHLSARFPAHLEKQATMPVNSDPINPSRAWGSIYIFKGPGKC